jgi:hypothetical protein
MNDLSGAIGAAIATADPEKLKALDATLDAYARDFPDEIDWALGGQAPALLHQLLLAIDAGRRLSNSLSLRLVPEGKSERDAVQSTVVALDQRSSSGSRVEASLTKPSQVHSIYGLPELW